MTNSLDLASRVKAYIENVEYALKTLKKEIDESSKFYKLIELASSYLSDAKFYFEKKDYVSSLSCIAYAEGLIDSLNQIGLVTINWKPLSTLLKRPKVLVGGSFEILHPGHLYFLEKAWELGEVYVVVSRDKNFIKFKKRKPVVPENQRKIMVENVKFVSKSILGDEEDFIKPIEYLKPDIILLGPDQWIEPSELESKLRERGLNIKVLKIESRVEGELYSSSSIINRICENICE
ncbi:MAG: DUF357 domain-containing protein [Desulfurococcaceae archaeon]|uniref:Cytidylyltransferase family protein n=1 Tax=Staphylothermus marinus TaxID=2280 RepID=A0A7C4NQ58_STAMA